MLPRVEGKPYEAEFERLMVAKLSDGKAASTTGTGMIARDSSGRRVEHHDAMQLPENQRRAVVVDSIYDPAKGVRIIDAGFRLGNIYDPVAEAYHLIDLNSGTTLRSFALGPHGVEGGPVFQGLEIESMRSALITGEVPESSDRVLGRKVFEEMECTGYSREGEGYKVEFWIAEDLQETIRYRLILEDREFIFRLYEILRIEPDPQLFVAPPPPDEGSIIDFICVPLKKS